MENWYTNVDRLSFRASAPIRSLLANITSPSALPTEDRHRPQLAPEEMDPTSPIGMLLLSKGSTGDPESRLGSTAPEIVAVHGFCGHREQSWAHIDRATGEETMWLKDFLPDYVPGSRVMTFGYNLQSEGISAPEIREKATELLEALSADRSADGSRSIVFIGHNLGGTIIMQALLTAGNQSTYSVIAASTSLLLFFGTPHRAADPSAWERLAYNMISTTRRKYQGKLSKILKSSSRALMGVSEAYYAIAGIYSTVNFYEQEEVRSLGSRVVDEHEATLDVPGEKRVGISRDHFNICQFTTAEDEAFKLACEEIRNASNPDNDYIECLRTLSTLDWKNYSPSTPLPHPKTLHWINDNEAYNSWFKNTKSCTLQINGRSGSGVSVLASFLSKLLLTSVPDAAIVNFSFNAEDDRQNSTHKMFVSLARQLLSYDPSSFTYVRYLYKLIAEESDWKIGNIWAFFRSMLTCPRQRMIICIIDGADECDTSQRQYLDDLLALAGSSETNLKIIITSGAVAAARPPTPPLAIDLDVQTGARDDIERIAASGISTLVQRRPAFLDFKEELLRDLLRPNTIILTTTLMLKRLEAVQIRSTPVSIRKELESLPRSLPEAYKCLVESIPPESSSWAWKAISWILHAFRPLKVNELALALAIDRDGGPLPSSDDQIPQDLPRDLRHALGGLVRIQNDEVLLVHKSAKEFLLKGHDGPCHAMDHASIAQACLAYLSNIDPPLVTYDGDEPQISLSTTKHYDLLTYAVQHWPTHYRLAKDKSSIYHSASTFLQNKKLMHMWSELHWCQGNPATRRRLCFNDPLPVAAELGFNDVVDALLKRSPLDDGYRSMALEVAAERGDEGLVAQLLKSRAAITVALHLAAQNGHLNVVSHLLAAGAAGSAWDHTHSTPLHLAARSGYQQVVAKLLQAGSDVSASNADGSTPLHLAAEFGHVEVIQLLLDAGAIPGMTDKDGSAPLHLATKSGQLKAVKMLLGAKSEVDATDHSGSTLLHLAVASRQVELVKALLKLHPSLSAVDHQKQTALHLAVLAGHTDVVEQLLSAGSDAKAVDARGSTPLHIAASEGHLNVIKWLLGASADPRASDNEGCSPLHLAARNGHLQLVEELLQANRDQGEADKYGSTPMHFAAANGHLDVVRALVDAKMSVTAMDNLGSSPLHLAARGGYLEMVKTLLNVEAVSNITDHTNSTPLHLAAQFGHVEVIRVLLGAGADPEAVDQGQSRPLHLAAQSGHLEAAQSLLDGGADADGGSDNESSPLHLAAKSGHLEVVKTLLARGADIEAKDEDGCTPLLLATEEGRLDVVKELLRQNANVKAVSDAKCTALHFAAQYENPDVLAELLEKGANPKSTDSDKRAPLHLAAEGGHVRVVKKLLAAGVDLDMTNNLGQTALWLAADRNCAEVVGDLLNAGANGDLANNNRATPLYAATYYGHVLTVQEILRHKVDVNFVGPAGWTALHAGFDYPEVIKLIIGAGAEVDILGETDGPPLWLAAANGLLESVKAFLELKANPIAKGKAGSTPLHSAASSGGVEVLRLFLDYIDFSPDVRDGSGFTPLRDAIYHNQEDAVKLLIDRDDVDINQKDDQGKGLLHLAIEMGHKGLTNILCDKGVDLTGPGDQLMMFASSQGDANGIQALMRRGVDPNKTDEHGWTAALLASVLGKKEALDVLLAAPGGTQPSEIHPLRPTLWSKTDHSQQLELDEDCLTVKYITDPDAETLAVATIRANHPIAPSMGTFYFEIEVVDCGENGAIGIGFLSGNDESSLSQMPGWEESTWGYHGDDGQRYSSGGQCSPYAEVWATGDVIGCHVNLENGELFYTRNGESLGIAFTNAKGWLFPAVGIQCKGAHIRANFGALPFRTIVNKLKDPSGRIEPKAADEPKDETVQEETKNVDEPKDDGFRDSDAPYRYPWAPS
ncbi:MAG: hypothetical protein M1840_007727 [Geoglossum simile]|nr:MAG: hypothetical protein M1840_007727 [Geoglossum simile]